MTFPDETGRARDAQAAWARVPIRKRLRHVRAFRAKLVDAPDELLTAIEADVHRPAAEVLGTDFLSTAGAAKYLESNADRILYPKSISGRPLWLFGVSTEQVPMPHGVVGIIGTWNYPLFLNAVPILHALIAGNAVLWKPSEQTPRTGVVLHRWLLEAGFPPDLVQMLPATRDAGPELVEADIDFLQFTGSDTVGRKLAARLGERLIPSVLELSGVDAALVLADADLDLAAKTILYGATLNNGQTCIATRRAFVDKLVYPAFAEKLKALVAKTNPVELQTPGQVAQMARLIADAAARGGTGFPEPTGRCRPTVILNGSTEMAVCREASFAPIVAVIPCDSFDDMVRRANDCAFGLSSSVFSAATHSIPELRVGSVVFNDTIVPTAHPATPFGGRGASGWGPTQGREGLLAMTYPKIISRRLLPIRQHIDAGLAHDPAQGDALLGMLRFNYGRGLRQRWRGLKQMIGGFRRLGKNRKP